MYQKTWSVDSFRTTWNPQRMHQSTKNTGWSCDSPWNKIYKMIFRMKPQRHVLHTSKNHNFWEVFSGSIVPEVHGSGTQLGRVPCNCKELPTKLQDQSWFQLQFFLFQVVGQNSMVNTGSMEICKPMRISTWEWIFFALVDWEDLCAYYNGNR